MALRSVAVCRQGEVGALERLCRRNWRVSWRGLDIFLAWRSVAEYGFRRSRCLARRASSA